MEEKLELGNLDIMRDWGWAPEYVQAMWLMLQEDAPDDYVIATGETNPLGEFVDRAFATVGLDWREHVVVSQELLRPSDIAVSKADPGKQNVSLAGKRRRK